MVIQDTTRENFTKKLLKSSEECIAKLFRIEGFETEAFLIAEGIYNGLAFVDRKNKDNYLSVVYESFFYAERFGENNPRLYFQKGIFFLFAPKEYGGGAAEAMKDFEKAINIFEHTKTKDELMPDWGYIESLAFLGQSLEQLGRLDEAKKYYDKVLEKRPDYDLVKKGFYPNLLKKMNKKK
jgi:tetratricopeptide (TPR) repeat protein